MMWEDYWYYNKQRMLFIIPLVFTVIVAVIMFAKPMFIEANEQLNLLTPRDWTMLILIWLVMPRGCKCK